jgi:ABC-2 type transport system ATP-binding protein
MVELKHIFFSYSKRKPIFKDLSMKLEGGKIYGLLGKNGAGKTTLLKNIAGLQFIQSGNCLTTTIDSRKRHPLMLESMYYLPEEIWLPDVTVQRYINMFASSWPLFDQTYFNYCLQEFEIDPNARLKKMSFGQQKKTAISFAFATNVKLLILDEPTNGLDIPSKSKFRKLAAELTNPERCIILSTHQVRDLETLIDTVIVLENSDILLDETIDDICKKLYFSTITSLEKPENVMYAELTPKGYALITTNPKGIESKIDMETLFNLCTTQPEMIKQLFNKKN